MNTYVELPNKIKERKLFIENVARLYAGREIRCFDPYMPNERDDSFWTIDMGNDWKIGFEKNKRVFYVMYRYHRIGDDESIEDTKQYKFAKLLALKYGGKIINKEDI